ncbi:K02A2.6-like, partial [Cordylochernes scorpioides]
MAENPNNRLQKFNGSKSAIRPESWIKLYDFENNSLKEDEKIKNLMYYLTDSALEWYADEIISNPAIKRWEVVKEKLIQRFGSYNANPIVSASHRRLKREESIENYFQDKIRLLNQTHLTKEEKINLLTDGLPNDWKDLIVAAQPADATKWFHIAASIEQNRDRPNQNTSVKQVCGAPELLNVSTLTNTPTQGAFKLINISVEVNGIPAQAFVDTGATVSIINWRLFKRTRLQLQPNSDIHISQADGVTRTCGSLQTKVRIDKLIKPVTLHVMKNFKYPLLIGLDVASLFNLLIDVKDKTIYTKFDGLQDPILVNHLEEIGEHEFKKLLEHNRNVFCQHAIDLGKVAIQHKIITKSEQPISLRPYRRPLKEYEEIAEQVKELLEHKLIRISDSPWAFPVVMVPKKDGNKRMCIDYRRLNEITLDDRQPLPHIQDMFDRLHGSRFFSTLDVAWGYWQIEMDPQSIQKTAFVTNDGHYEFLVMPFGLKNAASTFQRIIQHILGELLWKGTCSFQDDILVYTKTWQEHIELLSKVFDELRQYNMKLKLSKCIFGRTEVKYLGHIISHNQLKPDPGKVKSIQDFPRPDTVKKVRQFMGLANYYRKFVKDFSKISFPLVRLTQKNQPFIWNEEVEESFANLKMALSTKPVLAIYNPDYPSKVYTDASKYGIGAILTQIGPDNEEHVIAYYSKTLQPHQENYSAYEMECLAVIQATDHFHVYIENQPFEIITDHAALQWLFTMKKPKPKYFRWILSLSSKSCNIVHRSGKQQTHVDALSRLPVVNIATQELQEHQQNSDLSFLKNSHTHDSVVRHEPTLGEMITPTSNIQPLQMIGCDTIVLGTAAANTKHKFIQVFVDHATCYLWAYPTITNTAQAVTQCLDKIIKSVNSINTILTDNGKNFISKEFNKFLSLQGIKHTYTSPYHPQCNGICEKLNDTIMTKLRIAVLEKPRCKWSSLLPQIVKNYNSTPHDVTGFSPLFLMYGIGNVPEFADQTPITIEEARKKASLRTEQIRMETTDLNLDQVAQLATQYEKAQEDNKMFDNTPEGINKIAANDRRTEPNLRERKKISTNFKCLRCGGKHKATSPDCPAKDVKCHQCLKDGKVDQITESSKILETLPFAKDIEYKIFVDTSVPPVQQKLRRLPPVLLDEVHKEIQRLVKMDIIEPIVTSKWIPPIVVSKKKDGSIRLCVDLREPNKAVILDAYPIPLIEDILSSLHGCKVFTNLDLSQAYHQIRLHPDSRYLTAFITHMGIYQFKRLPYGLSSAPGAFQRYLSELLMDIKGVSCYLDDILIGGSSMEDHDKKLNQILSRLREVNLMLNDAKSIYRQKSLKFLGHIIDDNGVHLDEELMKPLLDAPPPKDKSGHRSLIGMINWFQKYIPNKSTIMEPLQKLLKKSVSFKWRGEYAKALQTVKDSLKKGQVLALFRPKLPTVITTDASHSGIGCVVSQLSEKGEERIVACASRTLSDAEMKYSIVEKEALACVWACEKFRRWVWGLKFTLRTDQSSLTTLLTTKGNDRAGLRITRCGISQMAQPTTGRRIVEDVDEEEEKEEANIESLRSLERSEIRTMVKQQRLIMDLLAEVEKKSVEADESEKADDEKKSVVVEESEKAQMEKNSVAEESEKAQVDKKSVIETESAESLTKEDVIADIDADNAGLCDLDDATFTQAGEIDKDSENTEEIPDCIIDVTTTQAEDMDNKTGNTEEISDCVMDVPNTQAGEIDKDSENTEEIPDCIIDVTTTQAEDMDNKTGNREEISDCVMDVPNTQAGEVDKDSEMESGYLHRGKTIFFLPGSPVDIFEEVVKANWTKKGLRDIAMIGEDVLSFTLEATRFYRYLQLLRTQKWYVKIGRPTRPKMELLVDCLELYYIQPYDELFWGRKLVPVGKGTWPKCVMRDVTDNGGSLLRMRKTNILLRKLSSTCNYGAMTEEMIRDRLVLGIIDKQTKRQLISDPQLTLQKAIDVCKANESANKQIENLTKNTQEEVNKLNIRKKTVNQNKKSSHEPNKMKKNIPCRYCATFHEHNRQKCPAWNQTCRKCNKNNHWAKVCKSRMRTVQSLESQNSNDEQEDCYSLEYVSEISARKLMTKLELELNGYKESMICQIDTGATVNVLNFADLCKIMQDGNPSLKPSYIKLRCYGGEILKPRGQIKINCSHQSKQHPIVFQVIDHWEKPILSAETCQKLNLIEIKADLCKIESTWTKQNNLLDKYKDIFEGIGCLQGEYKLETDPTIKPIKQAPRRVPITLRKELKEKLIDMEKKNIIAKVDYPTDWISNLVLVKSTKKLRICIDPRELNVALKRAEYPIPTIEEIIPNLQNAKIFTVVDTKDGFWNVKLSDESSNLTTFWTPFGRYKFLRMPFGLKTASEEYQRRLYEIFQGLEGIEIIADDILILGKGDSYEEALKDHDRNLENLFKTARQANLKFNINKVKLRLKEVKYLGHIITPHGLKPDPEKVKALKEMPHPESITKLKSFLGFATYLCKFMPNISMISEPLRKLTMKNSTWSWSKNHQAAFEQIKDLASKAPILRYFDADKSIAIQCDASKHGLGATLLQESQPIIFASRSLSKTEQNYAQIEKECLAIVFACERFHQYILGKCQVIVQTDNKPLLSIFKKSILKAPQRLQRMLLRLQRYNLELEHVQGSQMHLADIFSRACIKDVRNENLKYDVYPIDIIYKEIATVNVMETLSVCSDTVLRIREETSSDPILCEVKKLILNGWPPNKNQTSMLTREYWNFREELTVQDGIILKNDRIVIPNKLRAEMIMKTHQGHIGINSSMRRARDNIFWPGMNAQIGQEIENCSICLSNSQNQVREPMKSHKIPNYPWERISLDIFEIFKQNYLIIVDHYSDFFEVECLENTTSEYIIECCKRQFSRYGIPQIIVSDNGRQFTSTEFQKFSKEWQFQHSTSSPLHSQGNGKAEAAVKIAKNLLKKSKQENSDFWQNLLNWRNTPTIDIDSSPVQRIMSRRTRAILPIHPNLLKPSIPENIPDKISIKRQQAKYYYDRKSKNLPDLDIGQEVYVRTPNTTPLWSKANITNEHNTRSYDVNIHGRTYRRNRTWIKPQQASANQKSTNNQEEGRKECIDQEQTVSNCLPSTSSAGGDNIVKSTRIETTECRIQSKSDSPTVSEPENAASGTRTRSGRLVKKPKRIKRKKNIFDALGTLQGSAQANLRYPKDFWIVRDVGSKCFSNIIEDGDKNNFDWHDMNLSHFVFFHPEYGGENYEIPTNNCIAKLTDFEISRLVKNDNPNPNVFCENVSQLIWTHNEMREFNSACEIHTEFITELKMSSPDSRSVGVEENMLDYKGVSEWNYRLNHEMEMALKIVLYLLTMEILRYSQDEPSKWRFLISQQNFLYENCFRISLEDIEDNVQEIQMETTKEPPKESSTGEQGPEIIDVTSTPSNWKQDMTITKWPEDHFTIDHPESHHRSDERPANPWTKLGLDIVGPFIDTEIGFRFAKTLIDYTYKWPEVFCTNKTTSKVIINFLEDVFSREGFPREIVTDNGTPFISEEFEDFLRSNGIKHIRTANYHPACNGEVENFNKTLKSTVLTAHLQHTQVKRTIQLFLREYRSTPHTVTKQTPSAVLHGRTLRTLVHVFDKVVKTKPPEEACRQEDKSDSESKSCSPKLQVGDQVKVQAGDPVMKGRSKLRGPFTITKQLRPFTFVLSDGKVWNARRLRLYQKCAGTYTRPDIRHELGIHPALHLDDHASQEESTPPPDSSPIASRLRSKCYRKGGRCDVVTSPDV